MNDTLYIDWELADQLSELNVALLYVISKERDTVSMKTIRDLQDRIDAIRQSLMERTKDNG
jgi:hypothetical protein